MFGYGRGTQNGYLKKSIIDGVRAICNEFDSCGQPLSFRYFNSPLFAMIESGESWDERKDIRAGWKIAPAKVLE
jgi:hypothetical protein